MSAVKAETHIVGKRVFRPLGARQEWEHFIRCDCGKLLDMRKLDQVLMHEEACALQR